MAYNPGVSFFIPFHELDPSKGRQCIFFTQKGARCQWLCPEYDNRRAIELHEIINAMSSKVVGLDLLQEYVLCNCCRSGRAQHRDRIEDIDLLIPLARRWQDEIQRHAFHTYSVQALEESTETAYAHTILATLSPSHTTILDTLTESPFYSQHNAPKSSIIDTTPAESVVSIEIPRIGFAGDLTATESGVTPSESQFRYDLSLREAIISTDSAASQPTFIPQVLLSEFRSHVANPLPSDSVSWKIRSRLEGRDFEIGSVYIFDRASSPGHVKIGWTARSVLDRLDDWSKCGYEPNLLFELHSVPHAQRAETLTHHELLKEWRRERMCKAPWCGKSHQEWFETSVENAQQVLGSWAELLKRAEPYDSGGHLKDQWRTIVEIMDENGEFVTGKKLLELYEESLLEEATLMENVTLLLESVSLGHLPQTDQVSTNQSLSETEPQLGSKPISESDPGHEEASTAPVKQELQPEEIPLPPSPILPPSNFAQDVLPLRGTRRNLSFGTEDTCAVDTVASSDTNFIILNDSSKLNTELSISASNTASEAVPPQTNVNPSNDTSSQRLNFADAPSRSNPLHPSAAPAPPSNPAKPISKPVAPLSTNAPLSASTDEREKLAETLSSITLHQRADDEEDEDEDNKGQEEPETTLFVSDEQRHGNEITSDGRDRSTAAEEDTVSEADGLDDEDVTLVEDPTAATFLERAASKIVDELAVELAAATGSVDSGLKDLSVAKTLESEAPPAVQVVAQA